MEDIKSFKDLEDCLINEKFREPDYNKCKSNIIDKTTFFGASTKRLHKSFKISMIAAVLIIIMAYPVYAIGNKIAVHLAELKNAQDKSILKVVSESDEDKSRKEQYLKDEKKYASLFKELKENLPPNKLLYFVVPLSGDKDRKYLFRILNQEPDIFTSYDEFRQLTSEQKEFLSVMPQNIPENYHFKEASIQYDFTRLNVEQLYQQAVEEGKEYITARVTKKKNFTSAGVKFECDIGSKRVSIKSHIDYFGTMLIPEEMAIKEITHNNKTVLCLRIDESNEQYTFTRPFKKRDFTYTITCKNGVLQSDVLKMIDDIDEQLNMMQEIIN